MNSALVLNASYEPLCAVSGRRALLLSLNGKAEVLHVGDRQIHSERLTFEVPTVVRLLHYVKVPFHAGMAVSRRGVFVRDGGRCQYCDGKADSIDHVVPRSRGGAHAWDNVVAACRSCNSRKRDRMLHETSFVLRRAPVMPKERVWLLSLLATANPDWTRYIHSPRTDNANFGADLAS
jgi:5-methylcytosine-specific restriction endonuclease McrA